MKALKLSSRKEIKNSIQARLRSIKSQISVLEDRLKESTESVGRDISPHLAVNQKGRSIALSMPQNLRVKRIRAFSMDRQLGLTRSLIHGPQSHSNMMPEVIPLRQNLNH